MSLDVGYRFHKDTVNLFECAEAIGMFLIRPDLEPQTPPRHEDNEGRNPR